MGQTRVLPTNDCTETLGNGGFVAGSTHRDDQPTGTGCTRPAVRGGEVRRIVLDGRLRSSPRSSHPLAATHVLPSRRHRPVSVVPTVSMGPDGRTARMGGHSPSRYTDGDQRTCCLRPSARIQHPWSRVGKRHLRFSTIAERLGSRLGN